MSRSRVALLGVCGVIGATLLVSPLVNWNGGKGPSGPAGAYDPLLSDASCGESESQLALVSRPADDAAERKELAFLEGIMPAGGEGATLGTGTLYDQDGVQPELGGVWLPPGTNLPGGATDPDGKTTPGGILPSATFFPFGTNLPGGLTLPNGFTLPPGKIPDPPEEDIAGLPPGGPETNSLLPEGEECEGVECEEEQKEETCTGEECEQNTNNPPPGGNTPTNEITVAVSEPASLGLLGLGLLALGIRRRRTK